MEDTRQEVIYYAIRKYNHDFNNSIFAIDGLFQMSALANSPISPTDPLFAQAQIATRELVWMGETLRLLVRLETSCYDFDVAETNFNDINEQLLTETSRYFALYNKKITLNSSVQHPIKTLPTIVKSLFMEMLISFASFTVPNDTINMSMTNMSSSSVAIELCNKSQPLDYCNQLLNIENIPDIYKQNKMPGKGASWLFILKAVEKLEGRLEFIKSSTPGVVLRLSLPSMEKD
jgi:sensor histidine kinase regulating citrate/malate metabolism